MTAEAPAQHGFSPRTMFILLLVGLVGFVGFGVLTAYAPELEANTQGGENALSRSAVGYAGLVSMLRAEGVPVVISRGRLPPELKGEGLLILTPPPGTLAAKALSASLAGSRRTLVILPKWAYAPDQNHPGWVTRIGLVTPDLAISVLKGQGLVGISRRKAAAAIRLAAAGGDFEYMDPLPLGPTEAKQTAEVFGPDILLTDDYGQPVLIRVSRSDPRIWQLRRIYTNVYALSDPDLMNNQGIASLDTARSALAIIDELRGHQGPVVFDVTLNGLARARSLLGLALAPPFLGASLCALATALLMGAHAAARFGPARPHAPALALGKASLLDNSAMLIRLARREPKMGGRYAGLIRRALARRVMDANAPDLPPTDGQALQLDEALDHLTPAGEPPFSALAGETQAAHDTASLMRSVRRLHQRKVEILGEHH